MIPFNARARGQGVPGRCRASRSGRSPAGRSGTGRKATPRRGRPATPPRPVPRRAPRCGTRSYRGRCQSLGLWLCRRGSRAQANTSPASGRRMRRCTASVWWGQRSRSPTSRPRHDLPASDEPAASTAATRSRRPSRAKPITDPVQVAPVTCEAGPSAAIVPGAQADNPQRQGRRNQAGDKPDEEAAADEHRHWCDHDRRRFASVACVFRPRRFRGTPLRTPSRNTPPPVAPISASAGAAKAASQRRARSRP